MSLACSRTEASPRQRDRQPGEMGREFARMDKPDRMCSKPWNRPYAIVNDGRYLSYGHAFKPELTLSNHPPPPFDTKFDYSVPVMGEPSDYCHEESELERQDKLEKWRKYRVDLQEWESAQRLLQIKMAPKLPFEK